MCNFYQIEGYEYKFSSLAAAKRFISSHFTQEARMQLDGKHIINYVRNEPYSYTTIIVFSDKYKYSRPKRY